MPYKTKRECRTGIEHGFREGRIEKAGLRECSGGHVVDEVAVAVGDIGHDSRTATASSILKETPKTHQGGPYSLFSLLYMGVSLCLPPALYRFSTLSLSTKSTSSPRNLIE